MTKLKPLEVDYLIERSRFQRYAWRVVTVWAVAALVVAAYYRMVIFPFADWVNQPIHHGQGTVLRCYRVVVSRSSRSYYHRYEVEIEIGTRLGTFLTRSYYQPGDVLNITYRIGKSGAVYVDTFALVPR